MADHKPIQCIDGIPVQPNRGIQVSFLLELGRIGPVTKVYVLETFIYQFHLASFDDLLKKGLMEICRNENVQLTVIGRSLYTNVMCNFMADRDLKNKFVEQVAKEIDNMADTPSFHYTNQRNNLHDLMKN